MWTKLKKTTPDDHKKHGFTIVELLIVIVVIAILAAISVVAYNGIQQRARQAQLSTTVQAYAKALELYGVDHGDLPPSNWQCIGLPDDYPAEDGFLEGHCGNGPHHYYKDSVYSQATMDLILPYMGKKLVTGRYTNAPTEYNGTMRGLLYDRHANPTTRATLTFFLKGDIGCPVGTRIYYSATYDSTRCHYNISI